jgi:hypothetical protein
MIDEEELKERIIQSFREQGFKYNPHVRPPQNDKETYKQLQIYSKMEQMQLHRSFLLENLKKVRKYAKSGKDINPSEIKLELKLVKKGSLEEVLFRWWNFVWWSVPYQRGYGRMLRFILWDTTHNAPFGLISLQSPILKISVRDKYLGLPPKELDIWVNQSMQAQRLGALPPYNDLLGGKMVALAITCNELRELYQEKYKNTKTVLKGREIENRLLFLTTTSAFGKSSIYNRLKYNDEIVAQSLGYTQGSGSFHISEKLYLEILAFLDQKGFNTARGYGNGPSRKMRLIDKGLNLLGLKNAVYHNIKREFYLFPLAENLQSVISQTEEPIYYNRPFQDVFDYWLQRYCIPRAERNQSWLKFEADDYFENIITTYQLQKDGKLEPTV